MDLLVAGDELGTGNYDEGEDIEVIELTLAEALGWVDDGHIQDAKTIILLLLAQRKGWLEVDPGAH